MVFSHIDKTCRKTQLSYEGHFRAKMSVIIRSRLSDTTTNCISPESSEVLTFQTSQDQKLCDQQLGNSMSRSICDIHRHKYGITALAYLQAHMYKNYKIPVFNLTQN